VAEKLGMTPEREGDIEGYPVVFYAISKPL
jgi:hypothetical protein